MEVNKEEGMIIKLLCAVYLSIIFGGIFLKVYDISNFFVTYIIIFASYMSLACLFNIFKD